MTLGGTFKKTKKGLMLDGKFARSAPSMPDENVLLLGPLGTAAEMFLGLPSETFLYYAFATEKERQTYQSALRAGKAQPLLFKRQPLWVSWNAIDEIWTRAPKGLIGVLQLVFANENDWKDVVYVDMMSVRGSWQRNGINALMLKAVMSSERAKGRKLMFSKTTHAGQAFAEWWRTQGFDVTVEGEKPKKATRLLIDGEPV